MLENDTIAAISTPIGMGGIGIIRISGPRALDVGAALLAADRNTLAERPSHSFFHTRIYDPVSGLPVDECLFSIMRGPRSYTREDVVEINVHSGMPSLRRLLEIVLEQGARLAEPGEFTRRAFLSGRLDLTQAAAVGSLIRATNDTAARAAAHQAEGHLGREVAAARERLLETVALLEAAVDFSDEDIETIDVPHIERELDETIGRVSALMTAATRGRIYDRGIRTALLGRPNVGKSSLLNVLAKEDRAIVSPQPGTTRDIVEATVLLGDTPLLLRDTAGWRDPLDDLEAEGIKRSRAAMDTADLIILVMDSSEPLHDEDHDLLLRLDPERNIIIVFNKADLSPVLGREQLSPEWREAPVVRVCALTGLGLERLEQAVRESVGLAAGQEGGETIVADARQHEDLRAARAAMLEAKEAILTGFGEEVAAPIIKEAVRRLSRFIGEDVDEAVLDRIFSRFCIGK